MRAAVQPHTIDVLPFSIRAEISSINQEARTVDVVFSTGAAVERYDWMSGTRYLEKLSMDPKAIRLGRLNAGGPVLDSHSAWSVTDQLGAVVPSTARVEQGQARATLRFSKREEVTPVWGDIVDRILGSVSVGYRVYSFQEVAGKDGGIPTRTAIDWEPYEISMVSMPADVGAKVRDGDKSGTNPCVITRSQETTMNEETRTDDQSESIAERDPLDPGAPIAARTTPPAKAEPTDADLAQRAERERIQGITLACRSARMSTEMLDRLVREGTALVTAQAEVFEEMRKRGGDAQGPHSSAVRDVALNGDNLVHVRAGIENALLHRLAPTGFKLTETGRLYRGMTMLDVARAYLQARGIRVTDMSKNDLAGAALGLSTRGGMHTTSDFPELLADVARKTLRRAYEEAPQTFLPFVTRVTLPDYRYVNRLQLGDAPDLLEVKEHGEYTRGTIGEGKERYRLLKYGRVFAITREAIINDDTQALSDVPTMFGRRARIKESDLVYAQITSNPTMGDGNALFSTAHANLEADGDVISIASLGRARSSLRMQTTLDGALTNFTARYLLVPPSLETVADQFVTAIVPNLAGVVNPFAGKLTVIAEPRLETADPLAWYIIADPAQITGLEIAYLEGEEGPQVESRNGFNIDGVEIKCRLDFGTKVVDWRAFHKDPGEDVS